MTLYADLETYSEVPIKNGIHAYAEKAEVLLFLYAVDEAEPKCWDLTTGAPMPADLAAALADPAHVVVFHNGGMFDRIVLRHALDIDLPIERIHDTMVQALAHSLPGSLDMLGEVMNLDRRKDKAGKDLIRLFCQPRPKNMKLRRATRETHPTEWDQFISYGLDDIPPMRELYKKLPRWNYQGEELKLWHLDQKINNRGVCVDLDLARAAIRASSRAQKQLAERTHDMTGGEVQAATQRDKLLKHILESYGVELPDMQISTLERRIDDPNLPFEVRELLAVRLQASKTSASKYSRLLDGTSSDGRLRGLLQFCGASRTGRWAGRLFQPQNLPRPAIGNLQDDELQAEIDLGIEAMKADCEDLIFTNVMEVCSSAIRGCIVAAPGKKLCVADLSNIEGRALAWLAGEKWKLKAFYAYDAGEGHDLYKLAYAKSFGVKPEEVSKSQRQIGKVQELALGYQGGVGAFLTFAAAYNIDLEAMAAQAIDNIPAETVQEARDFMEWLYGQDTRTNPNYFVERGASKAGAAAEAEIYRSKARHGLSEQAFIVCDSFKRLWREAHPAISSWWKELETAIKSALDNPGQPFHSRKVKAIKTGAWLRIVLPSGRSLCYPSARIEDDGRISYRGINQYSRKWERIHSYGGKFAENVTQAFARDVLAHNMPAIDAAGYEIVLSVHDELLTETHDTDDYSAEGLVALMSTVPPWAEGLPLAADGFEAHRYHK